MKIHMIGHASIFVETQDARILMDPVLWDPFFEGLNESCPKREVAVEKLPEFDILVISHQHFDHFDLRSLAYLPKHVDVLLPADALILDTLRELGYRHCYPLLDFQKVRIGSTTLMTTRSEMRIPEFGMIFADPSGVFWNTVDTYFAPPTIEQVKSMFPQIDFLLSTWHVSLEAKYQFHQDCAFPFEFYGELLKLIRLIDPIAIAPGAQGWKYINQAAWQNQIVFPVTREQFCADLAQALPQLGDRIYVLDPGDILTIDQNTYALQTGGCNYVSKLVDDRELIEFAPVKVGNTLQDLNPHQYSIPVLEQAIEEAVHSIMPQAIEEHRQTLFAQHHQWQVIYQLEIIFPDACHKWWLDCTQSSAQFVTGRHPCANFFAYITASSFYDLIQKRVGWDYLFNSGEYRHFHKVYRVTDTELIPLPEAVLFDPLLLIYSPQYVANGNLRTTLDMLKMNHLITPIDSEEENNHTKLLNLGDLLIRKKRNRIGNMTGFSTNLK